ncbi:MAG: CUB domain-containing protein [Flavobacteriales bacterium]
MTPIGCGGGNFGDAFGWFTGTGNPVIVKYTPPATADAVMHVFSGTCAAPVLIGCSDACCNGAFESVTLATTLGTPYFVRIQRYGASTVMNGTLCVYAAPPPPANDDPCGATALTVNANLLCGTQTAGSLASATTTTGVATAPCNGVPNDDVWFKFTATGTVHTVALNNVAGNYTDMYMALYSGTCGALTNIGCSDPNSTTLSGLTVGSTYWVRVYSYTNSNAPTTTFNICVGTPPPPPANDDPCGATALTVNPNLTCTTQTAGTLVSATATTGVATAPCFGTPNDDIWFRFTATSSTHNITLNNIAGSTTDLYMAVYSGSCGALTNMACSDPETMTVAGLTIGNTYWVRVYSYSSSSGATTTFNVCVTTPPPAPGCGQNFYDPGGSAGNYANNTNSTVIICPTTSGDMVTITFSSFNTENSYDYLRIYNGTSAGAPLIATYTGTTLPAAITASNASGCLTTVFSSDGSGIAAGWAAVISCGPPPPPPANDNPCTSTALTVNPTYACTAQTAGTLTAATATTGVATAPCYGTPNDDVWFNFTATGPVHRISLNNIANTPTDLYIAVYSGVCGALTNIACSDPETMTLSGLTAGTTYWVRVYSYSNSSSATTTFNVCVGTPPAPPGCGQNFYDNGGSGGSYSNNSSDITTICPPAGSYVSLVFSSFNTEFVDHLRIYNGNSTGAPLLSDLTGTTNPGTIVATNSTGCLTAAFTSDGSVTYAGWAAQVICTPFPAGDCIYALHLHDSNGNGWGTSMVQVRINGGAWTNYTVTGADNTVLIGLYIGDLIEFNYINTGLSQGENSFTVSRLGDVPYYTSNTPPAAGITFSQTVSCSPPPAQPQDCAGGITVCGAQTINNNSTSTGQTLDLNTTNQGCLGSGERQGTWYFFSPQTAGTIAFSITPAATDDYDFAVWGPYDAAQCPSGPPLRCSYDAPGPYVTGLNSTATQTTEGAGGTGWVQSINGIADKVYVLYIDNFSTSGQAFQLDWQLGPGTSLDCTVLPVELLELSATARNPVIDVDWATATEHNSDHFSVERSVDNLHFEIIGQVAAAGDADQRNAYRFTDTRPAPGVNYYRLLQVDRNGTSALSHVVAARLDGAAHQPVLYPNPVDDLLNLQWADAVAGMHLVVRDAMGRVVLSALPLAAGNGTWQLGVDQLSAGCYAVTINMPNGAGIEVGMFIKR